MGPYLAVYGFYCVLAVLPMTHPAIFDDNVALVGLFLSLLQSSCSRFSSSLFCFLDLSFFLARLVLFYFLQWEAWQF